MLVSGVTKSKTMIVLDYDTIIHHQSSSLILNGTVLKESDDLVLLGMTFDAKKTFEKHLHSVGIMRKSWYIFYDRSEIFLEFCPASHRVLFSSVLLSC